MLTSFLWVRNEGKEVPMKTLTLDNWLLLDPAIAISVRLDEECQPHPATASDWLPAILRYELADHVPAEVRDLFNVAKGAMAYGLLFLPLFALATEQLFRVCEAAVRHRAKLAGATGATRKFQSNLWFLTSKGIIPKDEQDKWESIRRARDFASHPEQQMVANPAIAIQILSSVSDWLNRLYRGA